MQSILNSVAADSICLTFSTSASSFAAAVASFAAAAASVALVPAAGTVTSLAIEVDPSAPIVGATASNTGASARPGCVVNAANESGIEIAELGVEPVEEKTPAEGEGVLPAVEFDRLEEEEEGESEEDSGVGPGRGTSGASSSMLTDSRSCEGGVEGFEEEWLGGRVATPPGIAARLAVGVGAVGVRRAASTRFSARRWFAACQMLGCEEDVEHCSEG